MQKKIVGIAIAIVLIFSMLSFVVFGILNCEILVDESPTGEYQIVSWWTDWGASGYNGAFYLKEKGLFSKWHKLGTVPFSSKWLSETEFSIHYAYTVDEDNYKEYNVNAFF